MRPLMCLALAVAALAPMVACDSSPTGPSGPVLVTLAPGGTDRDSGLVLTFERVTVDSRCPADALCIHAGEAKVSVQTVVLGTIKTTELFLFDSAKRSVSHGSFTVIFEELNPYPFLSLPPIMPGDYRARFRIVKT